MTTWRANTQKCITNHLTYIYNYSMKLQLLQAQKALFKCLSGVDIWEQMITYLDMRSHVGQEMFVGSELCAR